MSGLILSSSVGPCELYDSSSCDSQCTAPTLKDPSASAGMRMLDSATLFSPSLYGSNTNNVKSTFSVASAFIIDMYPYMED